MVHKKQFFFALSILNLFCTILVQSQSLEIHVEDLTFHSTFEKECFYALENDSGVKNMFFLGLSFEKSMTKEIADSLYKSFLEPQQKILFSKVKNGRAKSINKYLYQTIHKIYLTKYNTGTSFYELLNQGTFNCVSSSMLFAIIFEKNSIPYEIRKLPEHVYLLVYPENKRPVKVETTDPINGYVLYTNFFKENYVRDLYRAKIISQGEFDAFSINELFNKHFYDDDNLDLKGLFGLQYLNETLDYYSDDDYNSALISAEKAYYLLPDNSLASIIYSTLSLSLNGNNFDSLDDVSIYAKAINYNLNTITDEIILNEFQKITQRYLFDNPDEEFYDEIYSYLTNNLEPEKWLRKISTIYHTELSRKKLVYSTDQKGALKHSLKALELSPQTIENQRLVYQSFYEKTKSETPDIAYAELTEILKEFPNLIENKIFSELKGNLLLNCIQWAFQSEKPVIGLNSLNEFENFMNVQPELNLNQSSITRAFSEVAIYYFTQNKKYKSIAVLKKGLKYAPTSYELKNRLRQLTQ